MGVDKSKIGVTFRHNRESRVRQESDLRAAGAQHIVHVEQQCDTWRDLVQIVREGDQVWVPWLALVATERGKDRTAPSGQPAEFILEVHEREAVVIETRTGRRSDDKRQRREMIADAVRSLRQGQRRPPASGKGPGRPPNAYSVESLAHNKAVWKSREYATNESAARHMRDGMTAREAWKLWGKSGRPFKRRSRDPLIPAGEHVYVMECEGGSKIGRSRSVYKRFRNLQRQGAKSIVKLWHRPKDANLVEFMASRFTRFDWLDRGHEWFKVPPEVLVEKVEQAIEHIEAGRPYLSPTMRRKR